MIPEDFKKLFKEIDEKCMKSCVKIHKKRSYSVYDLNLTTGESVRIHTCCGVNGYPFTPIDMHFDSNYGPFVKFCTSMFINGVQCGKEDRDYVLAPHNIVSYTVSSEYVSKRDY